jgi:hypothetical protein
VLLLVNALQGTVISAANSDQLSELVNYTSRAVSRLGGR